MLSLGMGEEGREGGREQPTTTRRGSVVWMRVWRYLIVPWRYVLYLQVVVKVVKIDRCMGVCTYLLGDQS